MFERRDDQWVTVSGPAEADQLLRVAGSLVDRIRGRQNFLPMAEGGLVVHRRPGRPFCARLRARLALGRVPHPAVNIHRDADAAAVVRGHDGGDELGPAVRLDGARWSSNPSYRDLRAATAG